MKTKNIFTKTNILIFVLLILFVLLAVFFFYKANEGRQMQTEEQEVDFSEASQELENLKEEVGFTTPSEEEAQTQMEELENLRN